VGCDGQCKNPSYASNFNMFEQNWMCDGMCIDWSEPCHGACPPLNGWELGCNNVCKEKTQQVGFIIIDVILGMQRQC